MRGSNETKMEHWQVREKRHLLLYDILTHHDTVDEDDCENDMTLKAMIFLKRLILRIQTHHRDSHLPRYEEQQSKIR